MNTDTDIIQKALTKAGGYRKLEEMAGLTRQVFWRTIKNGNALSRKSKLKLMTFINE